MRQLPVKPKKDHRAELKDSTFAELRHTSCVLATCLRNCRAHIATIKNLHHEASRLFKSCHLIAVESDSTDGTDQALRRWASVDSRIICLNLGRLELDYSHRTRRLAYCRNTYLDAAKMTLDTNEKALLIVFDSDGVLSKRFIRSFSSQLLNSLKRASSTEWFGITGITRPYYYDLWALRLPLWMPNDCILEYRRAAQEGISHILAQHLAIQSKKISLYGQSQILSVESAFNGFAIYNWPCLQNARYSGVTDTGADICEHVPFHRNIRSLDPSRQLLIDPCLLIGETPYERSPNITVEEALHQLLYAVRRKIIFQITSNKGL
jgi:hypothetical protein